MTISNKRSKAHATSVECISAILVGPFEVVEASFHLQVLALVLFCQPLYFKKGGTENNLITFVIILNDNVLQHVDCFDV